MLREIPQNQHASSVTADRQPLPRLHGTCSFKEIKNKQKIKKPYLVTVLA
jgi:hypothetical protein